LRDSTRIVLGFLLQLFGANRDAPFIEWLTRLIVAMRVDHAAARGRASTP
jgi:hypothetical protein